MNFQDTAIVSTLPRTRGCICTKVHDIVLMRLFTVCTDLDLLSAQSATKQNSWLWAFVTLYKHPNKIGSAVFMYTHTQTHTHTHTHTSAERGGEEEAGIGNICLYHLRFPVMHLLQMLYLHVQKAHHYMHELPITSGIYRTYGLHVACHLLFCQLIQLVCKHAI